MNAVIYARFSSSNQSEASIDGQLQFCYDYAKREGLDVIGTYIDRQKTGINADKRPEFQKMVKDSSKKAFVIILVYQLDRFSRSRYDSAIYKAKLKKNGVRVVSVRENISDDASGILMESVLEGMAEYYSRELSQKIRRGQEVAASKMECFGKCPYGYKLVEKKLAIDESTATYVKEIFERYAKGETMKNIADYLNSLGLKTKKGKPFTVSTLSHMLKNKKYCGYFIFKDTEIKDGIPAIVSENIWEEVHAKMEKNRQAPASSKAIGDEFILTTKIFCGHCGTGMVGNSGKGRHGGIFYYYTCHNRKKYKNCTKANVKKLFIENLVITECRKVLTVDNIKKIADEVMKMAEQEKDNSNYKWLLKRFKAIKKEQDNLINSLTQTSNANVSKMVYEKLETLDGESVILQGEMLKEEQLKDTIDKDMILFFLTRLRDGEINDIKYRKLLISTLVNKIFLYDDKIILTFNTQTETVDVDISLIDEAVRGSDLKQSTP
jgi:DNA invertase Pin-like site-specific DNA recombinase